MNPKSKYFFFGGGGGGLDLVIFFSKNPNLKKKFSWRGVGVGGLGRWGGVG